ncbi:MAG: V-type ATPase 116kDa subunit family protein [Candidatus Eisenbacteria bacterium]
MNRVSVLIMKDDMDTVFEEIARSGVLHLTRIAEIDEWAEDLQDVGVERLSIDYSRRLRRINELIESIVPGPFERGPATGEDIGIVDLPKVDEKIGKIESELAPILSRRRALTEKISELKGFRSQIGALVPAGLPVSGLMRSNLLASAIGTIAESQMETLRSLLGQVPSVVLPYGQEGKNVSIVGVVLRKDRSRLMDALGQVGFTETRMPEGLGSVSSEIESKVTDEMGALEQDLGKVKRDLAGVRDSVLPVIEDILSRVEAAILLLDIKNYCKLTEKTCLFSGWVPREKTDALVSALKERTEGRAIVEVTGADKLVESTGGKVEVPVLFKHPPFLKPFEVLVSSYGTPSYRMIDPTIFVGITFLLMFGMMFGDVGHGLVLLTAGIVVALKSKRWRDAGTLAAYCGAAAIGFGILFGSIFGLEDVLRTVWVKPLENITSLFKVAIGFGIAVVSLGIILNIINSLRSHSFLENFFDKAGPLVGVVYWAGVGIVIKFMASEGGMPKPVVFYGLFVAPLALFVVRAPILRLIGKRRQMWPDGVATYVMETVVEILEILMGYLANTVSFIRVAAFGLAHAGLFIAVFTLAKVVAARPGGLVLSWVVLILGNVVIILLEGLVVTIQALRLEYYEFFGKFFKGLGSKYEPAGIVGSRPHPQSAKGGE